MRNTTGELTNIFIVGRAIIEHIWRVGIKTWNEIILNKAGSKLENRLTHTNRKMRYFFQSQYTTLKDVSIPKVVQEELREKAVWRDYNWGCTDVSFVQVFSLWTCKRFMGLSRNRQNDKQRTFQTRKWLLLRYLIKLSTRNCCVWFKKGTTSGHIVSMLWIRARLCFISTGLLIKLPAERHCLLSLYRWQL